MGGLESPYLRFLDCPLVPPLGGGVQCRNANWFAQVCLRNEHFGADPCVEMASKIPEGRRGEYIRDFETDDDMVWSAVWKCRRDFRHRRLPMVQTESVFRVRPQDVYKGWRGTRQTASQGLLRNNHSRMSLCLLNISLESPTRITHLWKSRVRFSVENSNLEEVHEFLGGFEEPSQSRAEARFRTGPVPIHFHANDWTLLNNSN